MYQKPIQVINELPKPLNATEPTPSIGAIDQPLTIKLSWLNCGEAMSYDIYLGINPLLDDDEFMGNQTGTTYDPGVLLYGTTAVSS